MTTGSGIRLIRDTEVEFLHEMLFEAAAVNAEIRAMGREKALSLPFIAHYLENFGRFGDVALVAFTGNKLVGASWFRLFPENDKGFGFVSSEIPELTIAVSPEYRDRGFGMKLLKGLIEIAAQLKFPALSLSVDRQNPALELYERLGFSDAGISKQTDSSVTMILRF